MEIVLITNCSYSKCESPKAHAAALRHAPVDDLARQWNRLIHRLSGGILVKDLYTGPSAIVAKQIANQHQADWYVVSAGLGLVHWSELAPSYDLTVSGLHPSNVLRKIKLPKTGDASRWWAALAKADGQVNPVARLIKQKRSSMIVIALSARYLEMISNDLSTLDSRDIKRIRILTSTTTDIPANLRTAAIPYDQRLNAKNSPVPGPMASFPQRAAKHFLSVVQLNKAEQGRDVAQVADALRKLRHPVRKRRIRRTDSDVLQLARKLRATGVSSAHVALRLLRQSLGVACEQSRFVRIWDRVARK